MRVGGVFSNSKSTKMCYNVKGELFMTGKKRRNLLLAFIVIAFAFTITTTQTAEAATKLKVTAPKKIEAGKKAKVKVNLPATFKTSNKNVATVNKKGVVTAKKAGTVKITVTSKKNKALKKTVKITVTKPDDPVQPEPSAEGTLTAEYKGKIPSGFQYQITPYGAVVKLKKPDGTEEVLDPKDYTLYLDNKGDIIQRDGKEFATCICKYNNMSTKFEIEVVDVGYDEIPIAFEIVYHNNTVKKGEELDSSSMDVMLFYNDFTKLTILDDNSKIKFIFLEGDSSYSIYDAIYEETFTYKGEELYVCASYYIYAYYG